MRMALIRICLTCVALFGALQSATASDRGEPGLMQESLCLFFDAMMHEGKPDLRRFGLEPMHVVYESKIWQRSDSLDSLPNEAKLRDEVRRAGAGRRMLVLDIERWPLDDRASDGQFSEHAARLLKIAGWVRKYDPSVRLGYFGLLPDTSEYAALLNADARPNQEWLRVNERARLLAHAVDVTLPELYAYSDDPTRWAESSRRHIAEARRYLKPVYVFLWPQYATATKSAAKYEFLPTDFWATQLRTACSYADGVAIWGGWDPVRNRPAEWSADEAWWQATMSYIAGVRRPNEAGDAGTGR